MKDSELRGVVLQAFYSRRRENDLSLIALTERDLGAEITRNEAISVAGQLFEKGLIDKWQPNRTGSGPDYGRGKISALGIDVIEGSTSPPIAIIIDQSQAVSISDSSNVQVGHSAMIDVRLAIHLLQQKIDASNGSDEDKREAKSRLKKFLEHPLVSAIIGGLIGST